MGKLTREEAGEKIKAEEPIRVQISEDSMHAYLTLKKPGDGEQGYDEADVFAAITAAGIKGKVNEELVRSMVNEGMYDTNRLIAEGIPCKDGIDGYFEYFFHQKGENGGKPRILDDGSVDYSSVNTVGTVSEGDLIAVYHPSVPGHFGYSVKGELLKPKPPKGLPVPQVIGCSYDEETYSYYATMDGRVEATPTKLQVIGTLEINRNINVAYGNIYFMGDVIVYGDVDSGVEITASGSVTIGGTLQGSTIRAGEDITVRGGIIGDAGTGVICGGNLEARFLQYANVVAGAQVKARSILDCNISAGGIVQVTDEKGVISGGRIYSARGVDGQVIGNRKGAKTMVIVGKSSDVLARKFEYEKLIEELEVRFAGANSREMQLGRESKTDPSKSNLLYIVRQNKARILTEKKQLEASYQAIDALYSKEGVRAYVSGRKFYPEVIVRIDMRDYRVTDEMIRVCFRGSDDGVAYSFEE